MASFAEVCVRIWRCSATLLSSAKRPAARRQSPGRDVLASEGRPPHVVMMDLLMPGMGGIEATSLIKDRHPSLEVVAVTSFVAQDKVHAALQAGGLGYILKD